MIEPAREAQAREANSKLMKAITRTKYGTPDVLRLEEVEKPAPNDLRGVLVRVHAASVNPADRYDMKGGPAFVIRLVTSLSRSGMGLRGPRDPGLGTDAAGRVEAVASNVTQFKPGDEVFGAFKNAYAEYGVAREDRLVLKPANISFEEASAVPIAAITALQALRDKGHIQPGQKVLINGAGGGVGTFAVQIARSFGAEVTGVTSTENLDMVRRLGAQHVIDYTKEDFTRNGERYDLICDMNATHSISDYKRALNPSGTCVIIGIKEKIIRGLLYFLVMGRLRGRGPQKIRFFIANLNQKDLTVLKELLETGKIVPVIDRRYPLRETAEAMKYLETGHARGKIVINVAT